ncbi:MAG: hypothetical protein KDA45_10295, partial [Planctomycetales bacterium]|nr:hypothetical protein [Planctomycetales bacterium]
MTQFSFGFQWTTLTLAISLATMLGVCALSWFAWQRSGYRGAVALLELLRIAIVGACVLLLNQPETVQEFQPSEQPTIVVLGDHSRSMETRDVGLGNSGSTPLLTRRRAIEPLLDGATWEQLSDRLEIVTTPFGSEDNGSRSDLYQALSQARDEHPNLRAVVLASDGDWNEGLPPVQAAMRLRQEQIPIFTVPTGSQTRLPDLELLSFDVPTFGVAGKNVRLPFTIESSLPRDHVAEVELQVSDGTVLKQQIRVAAMGRTSDALLWKPEGIGDYTLTLVVPAHPEERLKDNNRRETPIAIREEKLKVLVVESLPRWEYRYLRNALSRDPGVEVHCLLFQTGLSKVGGGNRDYISEFPQALDELSRYDVVFLGD